MGETLKACLALLVILAFPLQEDPDYVRWLLESLDSPDSATRKSSYTALLAETESLPWVLRDFSAASSQGRQLRANLLFEKGDSSWVPRAVELMTDPDPRVRLALVRFLSKVDLSGEHGAIRAKALAEAVNAGEESLRKAAFEGLKNLDHPNASSSLSDLFRNAAHEEIKREALAALAQKIGTDDQLLSIAVDPGEGRSHLPTVLLALGQKGVPEAFAPIRRFMNDSDARVAAAARAAFSLHYSQLVQRREFNEAERNFRTINEGVPPYPETLMEEAVFHIYHTGNYARALESASRYGNSDPETPARRRLLSRMRSSFAAGQIHLLQGEHSQSGKDWEEGLDCVRRIWVNVDPDQEFEIANQLAVWEAKGLVFRALNSILAEDSLFPDPEALLQDAYEKSRDAQLYRDDLLSFRQGKRERWYYQVDEIFSGEFGLFPFLRGPLLREKGGVNAADAWRRIGEILSRHYPYEFIPIPPAEVKPFRITEEMTYRVPSLFPRLLAEFYSNALGEDELALGILKRLSEEWLSRLSNVPSFAPELARVEGIIGSVYMDQEKGDLAARAYERGIAHLEDYLRLLKSRLGQESDDPAVTAQLSSLYVSQAVNENVIRKNPKAARPYLESAVHLDPSPFNKVLLACYHARAGEEGEARRILSVVDPEPNLFYNIACTYSLLGEKEKALRFLEKHFESYYQSDGDRERSKQWALRDPDLDSLRDDPRFQRLVKPTK